MSSDSSVHVESIFGWKSMQYLRYQPLNGGDGVFFFPLPAIVKYLEYAIAHEQPKPYVYMLRDLVAASKMPIEIIPMQPESISLDDYVAADFIDQRSFTVFCPHCDTHYTASQIQRESWSYFYDASDAGGGRAYRCTLDHILLTVQDWVS